MDKKITVTGNTVIDALQMIVGKMSSDDGLSNVLKQRLLSFGYDIERLSGQKKLVLITGHRRENFGAGFLNICNAIKELAQTYLDVDFVYPMHLNPNVRKPIHEVFGEDLTHLGNVFFIEPLEYLEFIYLMSFWTLIKY